LGGAWPSLTSGWRERPGLCCHFVLNCPLSDLAEVVVVAAFALKSHFAKNIIGYGENGDKRTEYGEAAGGKR